MGMNIPFVAYVLYHSCIKISEEDEKKAVIDVEKLESQHAPSVSSQSSQSSRASSSLPSGFSEISVDESELLEEFFHKLSFEKLSDAYSNEFSLSHDSSLNSFWDFSSSQTPSQHPESMEEDSL